MRDAKEIQHLQTEMSKAAAMAEAVDSFEYGLMCGKLYALNWVQGEMTTGAICVHETFEDFMRESLIDHEDMLRDREERERRRSEGEKDEPTNQFGD